MVPAYGNPMMPAYGMVGAPMGGCVPVPCAMPTCPCLMRRNGLEALMNNENAAAMAPMTRRNSNVQSGIQQHGSNNQNAQSSKFFL